MGEIRDVIIIGSGPAGYTAGVYTSRAQLNPLLFAGELSGGQLMNTTLVENWPGTQTGVMGPELMMEMREQAKHFGTEILDQNVTKVDFSEDIKKIYVGETQYQAKTVIVATGATSKMLEVPGEHELLGRGVATCAVCDAAFYRDKITFVVGGGDAAIEDAMALTKFAKHVTMLVRGPEFRASKIMVSRALQHEKISVLFNTKVQEIKGDGKVSSLVTVDTSGKTQELPADGVFIAIGHLPNTALFTDKLALDKMGYLLTHVNGLPSSSNTNLWLSGYPTMTSISGVFGAGDVVDFRYRQAVTSAGMGCMAAIDVEKYLQAQHT